LLADEAAAALHALTTVHSTTTASRPDLLAATHFAVAATNHGAVQGGGAKKWGGLKGLSL